MQYWHWKLRAVRCSQSNDLYRVSEWREIKSLKFTIHKNKISLSATNNDSLWPNKRFIGLWCQCSLAVLLNQRMHRATLNSFSFLLTVLSPDCVHKPHTWHFINVGGAVLDVVVNQQKKKKKTKKKKKRRIHRQIYTDEQSEQKKREYKSHSYLFSFSYKSYFFDKIVSSFTSRNRRIFICISCQWKKIIVKYLHWISVILFSNRSRTYTKFGLYIFFLMWKIVAVHVECEWRKALVSIK